MKKHTDEEVIAAFYSAGSATGAARALGAKERTVRGRIASLRACGMLPAKAAYETEPAPVYPEGHHVTGVSSLVKVVDEDTGTVSLQWVKTARDAAQQDALNKEVLDALRAQVPRAPRTLDVPVMQPADLLNLYVLTDYHVGMYAWGEETGADWDTSVAESLVSRWFTHTVARAPAAHTAVLGQLGDFLHYDSLDAVTPSAKNVLDADTRAQNMVRVGLRVLRRAIELLLAHHEHVIVLLAEGNHDMMASAWLREAFTMFYADEPRVEIIDRPDPYYAVRWGATGLFFHHGHLKKPEVVDRVFARKFRDIYGAVEYAYGHLGHMHSKLVLDSALMRLEQHPTLAGADSYASRNGYLSDRAADCITYSKLYGEVSRFTVSPKLLAAL